MFLIIHNLPAEIRTADIKALILAKCGLEEVILDNLVNEGRNKKVTVALADESDAAILVRKINGLFLSGQQLYVENVKLSKASEQPYRSTKAFPQKPQKEMYPEPAESRSFVNPGYDQDSQSLLFNNGNQALFNPSQGLYNPNGQVLWDQAAMMMNYNMGMGVGGMMYVPPVGNATPFLDYSGQTQSQTGLSRQGAAPVRGQHEEEQRDWPRQPPHADSSDQERSRFDSKWDVSDRGARTSRWEESTASRAPIQRDVWPRDRSDARDLTRGRMLYDPEDNFLNLRDPLGRQVGRDTDSLRRDTDSLRRDTDLLRRGRPDVFGSRDTARQSALAPRPALDPWNTSDSFTSQNFEERQIAPTRDLINERFDKTAPYKPTRDPMNERFDKIAPYKPSRDPMFERFDKTAPYKPTRDPIFERFDKTAPYKPTRDPMFARFDKPAPYKPIRDSIKERFEKPAPYKPWQQKPAAGAPPRLARPATRFDSPQAATADERRFMKPGPRDGTNSWRAPREEATSFTRNQKPGGVNKRPLLSDTRDKFASKPSPARRDRDEPPTKRFAGPSKFNTPNVTAPAAGFAGKNMQPPSLSKLVQRDETWRGQASAQMAKAMVSDLGLVLPPKDPVIQALKRSIRTRLDQLIGNKKANTMADYIKMYRDKYSPETDQEFYNSVKETVSEEEIKNKTQEESVSNCEAVKAGTTPASNSVDKKKAAGKVAKNASAAAKSPAPPRAAAATDEKLPKYPGFDKKMYKSQKKIQKLEISTELYQLEPAVQKALDEQADTLCDLFMGECEGAANDYEKRVSERISDHVSDEFRKVVRLLVTKRILDVKSSLLIRVHFTHGPPDMVHLTAFLKKYGALSLRKSAKQKVYIVMCDSYEHYDELLQLETTRLGAVEMKFKPLHLTGPAAKMSRPKVLMQRSKFIQNQVTNSGRFLDKVIWPKKKTRTRKRTPKQQDITEAADPIEEDSQGEWEETDDGDAEDAAYADADPETADVDEETADVDQETAGIGQETEDVDQETAKVDQETANVDQETADDECNFMKGVDDENIPDVDNLDEDDLEEW